MDNYSCFWKDDIYDYVCIKYLHYPLEFVEDLQDKSATSALTAKSRNASEQATSKYNYGEWLWYYVAHLLPSTHVVLYISFSGQSTREIGEIKHKMNNFESFMKLMVEEKEKCTCDGNSVKKLWGKCINIVKEKNN